MIDYLTAFPTSIFTGLLAFCVSWWLMTFAIPGLDVDFDVAPDADSLGGNIGKTFGVGAIPFPLVLSMFAFGAWATSLMAQVLLDDTNLAFFSAKSLLATAVAALGGIGITKASVKPLSRVFETQPASSRLDTIGAFCRIRTLTVTPTFGDAEVISGPTKGAIVSVRADENKFRRGDVAHLINFNKLTSTYDIDDVDEAIRPTS